MKKRLDIIIDSLDFKYARFQKVLLIGVAYFTIDFFMQGEYINGFSMILPILIGLSNHRSAYKSQKKLEN